MLRKLGAILLAGYGTLGATGAYAQACNDAKRYWIGSSQDDITGAVAEVGMMGYAELSQVAEGLHMRLRSRALVVSDACEDKTLAIVVADLGQVFGGLKDEVLRQVDRELPGVFTHKNLLFSATHTHAGPGGYAHHALYNITTLGFDPEVFRLIAAGTARSLVKAYRQRQEGQLRVARGALKGWQYNRSPEAYAANPLAERQRYEGETDPEMLTLAAADSAGRDRAAFSWFAVHPVSLPLSNKLISGDNKGLASYLLEKAEGASYLKDGEFIAAFPQANAGDISPYDVSQPPNPERDFWQENAASAKAQADAAAGLLAAQGEELSGALGFAHKFTDVAQRQVDAAFTQGAGAQASCQASLGVAFAAGTENGRPFPIFKEGTIYGTNWPKITLLPEEQLCHAEKVILLPTGLVKPDPWTARVAPFQLLRIGQLAIIGAPFEMTTMAGRRLKEQLLAALAPAGIRYVALTTLANDYLHYVTTREEYAVQAYEGGSNLYGPWSLALYTQIFSELAGPLVRGESGSDEAEPLDLSKKQLVLKAPVLYDAAPAGAVFGQLIQDVEDRYRKGERVQASFWGAHPHNSLAVYQKSLLTVEKRSEGRWETVRYDWDPDSFYRWKREGVAASEISIAWQTPADVEPGYYRLCHEGRSKALLSGRLSVYRGCSSEFAID